jgi:hypothetical protein
MQYVQRRAPDAVSAVGCVSLSVPVHVVSRRCAQFRRYTLCVAASRVSTIHNQRSTAEPCSFIQCRASFPARRPPRTHLRETVGQPCRFRAETLRRCRVPEDLIRLWLGHSKQSMTDLYASGLASDEAWRQQWCEQAGIGFGLQGNEVKIESAKAGITPMWGRD